MAKKDEKLNNAQLESTIPSHDREDIDFRHAMEHHANNFDSNEHLKKNEEKLNDFKRGSKKHTISTIIFIVANVLAIAITIIMEYSRTGTIPPLGNILAMWGANFHYIVFAFLAIIVYYVFDSLKFLFMIRRTTKKWRPILSVKVSILGKYYDNITPLASGGQPFQIYYLNKEGVPGGPAGAMPVVNFFFSQLAFFLIGIILFLTNTQALLASGAGTLVTASIGALIAFAMPLTIIVFSIFPKFAWKITKWVLKLLHRMRIIKDLPKTKRKVRTVIFDYARSLGLLNKSKLMILLNFILSSGMQIAFCSIPFFVLRACGHTTTSWIDILTMCFAVYAAVSYIPTPGNSGAAEISFGLIFAVLSSEFLFWGTLLWRGLSYYITLLFGIAILLINSARAKKKRLAVPQELAPIETVTQDTTIDEAIISPPQDNQNE